MIRFKSHIHKLGINPVIDLPDGMLDEIFERAGRSKGPIPVRGSLNGTAFVQTLVRYKGRWRLYVNGEMMKASGVAVSDVVDVLLEYDPDERTVRVPTKFKAVLDADVQAAAAFMALTPGRQKEILRYLGSLKAEASLDRNIARVLAQLRGHAPE